MTPDREYTTVSQLVERLQKMPQDATIGVRACCCGHAHGFKVRLASDEDFEDEAQVIIDAQE